MSFSGYNVIQPSAGFHRPRHRGLLPNGDCLSCSSGAGNKRDLQCDLDRSYATAHESVFRVQLAIFCAPEMLVSTGSAPPSVRPTRVKRTSVAGFGFVAILVAANFAIEGSLSNA